MTKKAKKAKPWRVVECIPITDWTPRARLFDLGVHADEMHEKEIGEGTAARIKLANSKRWVFGRVVRNEDDEGRIDFAVWFNERGPWAVTKDDVIGDFIIVEKVKWGDPIQ